ncbi:hypothetical protein ACHAWF_006910 [Thalassiosira exigua]
MLGLGHITKDCRDDMNNGFTSGAIHFWTDCHRIEMFGAFVLNLVGKHCAMDNGQDLFMSQETRDKLTADQFLTGSPVPELAVLEYPLNFEMFQMEKTIDNVVDWIQESVVKANLASEDFDHLSADGCSNAIGPIREFEMKGSEEARVNNLDSNICAAPQNECSCNYSSRIGCFVENMNKELGDVLKKYNTIQTKLNRHTWYDEVRRARTMRSSAGILSV